VQYEGGTCWHALVRYSREIENKEFTFCRINTGFPSLLTEALSVANLDGLARPRGAIAMDASLRK
jgi:hypothetical protein